MLTIYINTATAFLCDYCDESITIKFDQWYLVFFDRRESHSPSGLYLCTDVFHLYLLTFDDH